jgi:hypothetical protein
MERFTTHITFVDGTLHREDPVTADKLGSTITRLCEGPAALMGIIKSAIIVDSGDSICVEIKGRDITFPPQLAQQQAAFRKAQKSSK